MKGFWVWFLVGINVLVWLANVVSGIHFSSPSAAQLLAWGGNFLPQTINQPWRLITSMFLHGGISHLGWNMLGLVQLGFLCLQFYGRAGFLTIYFVAGLFGSLCSLFFGAKETVSVGASGAIFGLLGAIMCGSLTKGKHLPTDQAKGLLIMGGIYVALNIFMGLTIQNIDNAAHAGGFLGGAIAALGLAEKFDRQEYLRTATLRLVGTIIVCGSLAWGIWQFLFQYFNIRTIVVQ